MLLTIGFVLGFAAPAAQPALTLQISSPQTEVLVGEPVKLVVRLKAVGEVMGIPLDADELPVQFLHILVDDGTKVRTYVEYARQIAERVLVAEKLRPGDHRVMNVVLFNGGYVDAPGPPTSGFLLPLPGRFSIRVVYAGQEQTATSNPLGFIVRAPGSEDREIIEAARREPRILDANGDAATQQKARELVEKFPHSAYLRWTKIRLLERKADAPDRELDQRTAQDLRHHDKARLEQYRIKEYVHMTEELLSDGDWGPFEEEALAVGILAARGAGDKEKAERAKATLYAKYPESATTKRLKVEEAASDADDDHEPMVRPLKPARKPSPKPDH